VTVVAILLLAAAAAIALGIWIIRAILHVLGGEPADAARSVASIAAGDLTARIATTYPGSLLANMESMRLALNKVIRGLADNAGSLASFSEELAAASAQVATGAAAGSDAASSMAASVEEMTVSIAHVAESAASAAGTATQAGLTATDGSSKVLNLARSMSAIAVSVKDSSVKIAGLGRQSDEIRSIVGVIKEIADQTNLLALNAAIEAARAGESGRGFAVVADEVRKLAERTRQSTEDIAQKIAAIQGNVHSVVAAMNQSVDEVSQGERLAAEGAQGMDGIRGATSEVVGIVKDISEAIRENSSASHEVAQTVEHIAQLSEENSSAARQVATTASDLTHLAAELKQVTMQFKTTVS